MKEELLNKIISVAYGDANLIDTIKIRRLAEKDAEVKKVLEEYSRTAENVHSIELEEYPIDKLPNTFPKTESRNLLWDLFEIYVKKPATSTAAVTAVLLVIITSIVFNLNSNNRQYTDEELNAAKYQVKQSLAIVSEVFNNTRSKLKNDVLKTRVKKPIQNGFDKFSKIINEGETK